MFGWLPPSDLFMMANGYAKRVSETLVYVLRTAWCTNALQHSLQKCSVSILVSSTQFIIVLTKGESWLALVHTISVGPLTDRDDTLSWLWTKHVDWMTRGSASFGICSAHPGYQWRSSSADRRNGFVCLEWLCLIVTLSIGRTVPTEFTKKTKQASIKWFATF